MTNSRLTDPEVLEWRYPVLLESFEIRRGLEVLGRIMAQWGATALTFPRRYGGRYPSQSSDNPLMVWMAVALGQLAAIGSSEQTVRLTNLAPTDCAKWRQVMCL